MTNNPPEIDPGEYADLEILSATLARSPERQTPHLALSLSFPGGAQEMLPLWLTRRASALTRSALAWIAPDLSPLSLLEDPRPLVGRRVGRVAVKAYRSPGGTRGVNLSVVLPLPPPIDGAERAGIVRDLGW